MQISACLIVRDEAERLGRCLASLQGHVDEIVVVDTGSSDDTISIARGFTERVLNFTWCNDFAAARNHALDAATGDWILSIDADEWLAPGAGPGLRVAAAGAAPDVDALQVFINNLELSGEQSQVTQGTRFFRRHPDLRWQGRVHEVIHRVGGQLRTADSTVCLLHDGYLWDVRRAKDKSQRNLSLLQREVREHPEPRLFLYLSNEYRVLNDWDGTLLWARRTIEASRRQPVTRAQLARAYQNTTVALATRGRFATARAAAREGLAALPDLTDLQYSIGLAYLDEQRYEEALLAFDRCLAMGQPDPAHYWSPEGLGSFLPHHHMGIACEQLGHDHAAVQHYTAAVALSNGTYVRSLAALVHLLARREGGAATLDFVQRRLGLNTGVAGSLLGAFLEAGCAAEAEACRAALGPQVTLDPASAALWALCQGDYADAALRYTELPRQPGEAPPPEALLAVLLGDPARLAALCHGAPNPWRHLAAAAGRLDAGEPPSALPPGAREWALELVKRAIALAGTSGRPEPARVCDALLKLQDCFVPPLVAEIGTALLEAGRVEEAAARLIPAAKARPQDAAVQAAAAAVLCRRGEALTGAELYARAAILRPQQFAWHRGAIEAFRKAGHPDLAATAARRALRYFPDSAWLSALLAKEPVHS